MIHVSYCVPSRFGVQYATGSRRFSSHEEFVEWLRVELGLGKPVIITEIRDKA